jgi:hypothetical protein
MGRHRAGKIKRERHRGIEVKRLRETNGMGGREGDTEED